MESSQSAIGRANYTQPIGTGDRAMFFARHRSSLPASFCVNRAQTTGTRLDPKPTRDWPPRVIASFAPSYRLHRLCWPCHAVAGHPPHSHSIVSEGDRYRSTGIRFKQRKPRPTNQPPEVTIKTDQVFTEVDRRSGKPCIRHGISFELLLDAKLPQAPPLRAERRKVDTLSGEQRIDKGQGLVDRRWLLENLGTAYQLQEAGQHHWHKNQRAARSGS